jgi:hypothetical protein
VGQDPPLPPGPDRLRLAAADHLSQGALLPLRRALAAVQRAQRHPAHAGGARAGQASDRRRPTPIAALLDPQLRAAHAGPIISTVIPATTRRLSWRLPGERAGQRGPVPTRGHRRRRRLRPTPPPSRPADSPPRRAAAALPANAGPSAARNRGIAAATGSLDRLPGCDDRWPADRLAAQLAVLEAHPDLGWSSAIARCSTPMANACRPSSPTPASTTASGADPLRVRIRT